MEPESDHPGQDDLSLRDPNGAASGDLVGRDQVVMGDEVHGDKVMGDKVVVVQRAIRRTWRYWASLAAVGTVLIAALAGGLLYAYRTRPMGAGFNIAVAPFTMQDESGRQRVTPYTEALSQWLFDSIGREVAKLPESLQVELRGPEQVKAVRGDDRDAAARQIAEVHNATLLIYGYVEQDPSPAGLTGYLVHPEFYVEDDGFEYGSEVTGAERLGSPVQTGSLVDPGQAEELNRQFLARVRVLQNIVSGLAYLYFGDYPEAEIKFEAAASDPEWADDQGKEVGYLLLGAARLLPYDPLTNPDVLEGAADAFQTALDLNPDYARPHLGLGETALLSATRDHPDQAGQLQEAAWQYQQALESAGSDPLVAARAEFGLGRVHLLGYQLGLPEWSRERASEAFNQVIAVYDRGAEADLAWQAAHSQGYLGRLAGLEEDWPEMASRYRTAIAILDELPGRSARAWEARYWENVGFAEARSGNREAAISAYRQAVDAGADANVTQEEYTRWESILEALEKGAPPNEVETPD